MPESNFHVQDHPKGGEGFDREIGVRAIVGFGIGIVVLSVLTGVLIVYLFKSFEKQDAAREPRSVWAPAGEAVPPPEPRLQIHPEQELQHFLAEQRGHLQSYGWVDREHHVAHVPIDAAMDIVLERGLPVRSTPRPWVRPGTWRDPSMQTAREVIR